MWVRLAFLTWLINFAYSQTVTGISTLQSTPNQGKKQGSLRGGTILYVTGDFSQGTPSDYTILIGSNQCAMDCFHSGASKLQCVVPNPGQDFASTATISVWYKTSQLKTASGVDTNFYYTYRNTPLVLYMNPSEACPGDTATFVGRW